MKRHFSSLQLELDKLTKEQPHQEADDTKIPADDSVVESHVEYV